MTIEELKEQEEGNYTKVVIEEGTSFENATEISEDDVLDSDEVRDWIIIDEEGDLKDELHILVQPEKVIKYIHVDAPAPQYAINSISRIRSAIVHASVQVGIYAREESSRHSIPVAIILEPDTTEEQVEEMFKVAKEYMEDEGYTGVDASSTMLTYDAGMATAEESESTRNW